MPDFSEMSNSTLLNIALGSWAMMSSNSERFSERTASELNRALRSHRELLARVAPHMMIELAPGIMEVVKEDGKAAAAEIMRRLKLGHPEPES